MTIEVKGLEYAVDLANSYADKLKEARTILQELTSLNEEIFNFRIDTHD